MKKNENTFFYKRNFTIGKDKVKITPENGDNFVICKDKDVAYKNALEAHDKLTPEYEHVVESYSTEDLGEGVTGYQMCEKLSTGGKEFDFVGFKAEYDSKNLPVREFYLF